MLGPVDLQLGQSPAASILTVLERKKPDDIDDETLILADVGRKAIAQVKRTAHDLLTEHMAPEQAATLAEKLSTGTWTHDYPITAEEAKALGLPVSLEMPEEAATLAGAIDDLAARGFTEHFTVANERLRGAESDRTFAANQVVIAEYHRFEGVSDPSDMSIVYAIEARGGIRGTLVDAFGVYADPLVGAFIVQIDCRRPPLIPGRIA